ncbi:MAG TPA: glutathionylspermidine synthase family protein [Phycisphaerales bacterium]|nr:glutathionylspermidine synthase family protein [Phycisphaerales bacterium]
MHRRPITPRPDWRTTIEQQGFIFHDTEDGTGRSTWDESAYYSITLREAEVLESATQALHEMCLEAVDHLVTTDQLARVGIAEQHHAFVQDSWTSGHPSLYGRFDLAYDGRTAPKLLEYNADTPTSLLESAVVQWYWFQDRFPKEDQFNSLHEKLIAQWRVACVSDAAAPRVHLACIEDNAEDFMTVSYLQETALQASLLTTFLPITRVGWNAAQGKFLDEQERPINTLFKLYPWEWLFREDFSKHIARAPTRWIEPAWKAVLSNKAILAVLWELFPRSEHLLPASFEPLPGGGASVRKPIHSREGANIQTLQDGRVLSETPGPYTGPYVYQALANLPRADGKSAVIGSWVIGDEPCGIGIREDASGIVTNTSAFVPHIIERA